jgi:hypothetical protein
VPFEPWHLDWLQLQPAQVALSSTLTVAHGQFLQQAGPCYSAFVGMDVIACAGVVEFWTGRAQVWSLLSEQMPQHTRTIHRAVKRFLADYRVARLECVVDPRSLAACRWAEHLGFVLEGPMPKYTPAGETQLMLVRLE